MVKVATPLPGMLLPLVSRPTTVTLYVVLPFKPLSSTDVVLLVKVNGVQ